MRLLVVEDEQDFIDEIVEAVCEDEERKADGQVEIRLKNIFVPFYRIEKAKNSEGFGLGLAWRNELHRYMTEKCRGKRGEKRSCFFLMLPV